MIHSDFHRFALFPLYIPIETKAILSLLPILQVRFRSTFFHHFRSTFSCDEKPLSAAAGTTLSSVLDNLRKIDGASKAGIFTVLKRPILKHDAMNDTTTRSSSISSNSRPSLSHSASGSFDGSSSSSTSVPKAVPVVGKDKLLTYTMHHVPAPGVVFKSSEPKRPWQHGILSREEAEKKLREAGAESGIFLVREKEDGTFAISLCHAKNCISHFLMTPSANGWIINNVLLSPRQDTLDGVISALKREIVAPLPIRLIRAIPPLSAEGVGANC